MARTLGILIPSEALEDDVIYEFCKPYIEDGIFQELKLEKAKPDRSFKLTFTFSKFRNEDALLKVIQDNDLNIAYATWAYQWWDLFCERKMTKVLEAADILDWTRVVRLMIEKEKRNMRQMYHFFKWMSTLSKDDKDAFWYQTVDSVSGIRKHWDKIEAQWWKMGARKPKEESKTADGF